MSRPNQLASHITLAVLIVWAALLWIITQ